MGRFRLLQTEVSYLYYKRFLRFVVLVGLALYSLSFSLPPIPTAIVSSFQNFDALADSTLRDTARTARSPFFPSTLNTANEKTHFPIDSLGFRNDSLHHRTDSSAIVDTTHWVAYLDSTVRMKQFVYKRADHPTVEMFPSKNYSLFLDLRSPAYKRDMEIDSTGKYVTVREKVNGLDVKVPMTMTLGEYIKDRFEYEKGKNWHSFVSDYQMKQKGDELANLFGSLTRFTIPVPSNPLLSIFGGKNIDLRITGAVDIHGAYRRTASDQVTTNVLDQVRDEPDFNQDVQVNVNGTVGDKLNILADWNTQRTFEYENQLKIKYTGYDDEIVQSVEAGNVSLQTPSFIGGSQALFGIKAKMQTGPLTLTTLLSQKKGQTKELVVSSGAQQNETVIKPDMYSTSYYFVDTLYRKFFQILYSSTAPLINSEIARNRIVDIDVWVSRSGTHPNPNERQVNAYIDLGSRQVTDAPYSVALDSLQNPIDGRSMTGRFVKLDQTQYKVNRYAGFITLSTNVSDDQAVAVAYRTEGPDPTRSDDDLFYGQLGLVDTSNGRPLILKLVKPRNLQPSYKPAWDLQLKNIYPIGGRDLKKEGFDVKIFHTTPGKPDEEVLQGKPLLQVLGLDRFNSDNIPPADNNFDFIPTITVDVDRAEIIFPSLRPFDSTIVQYFSNLGLPFSDSLLFSDVYDTTKIAVQNNTVKNNYYMKVKASTAQRNSYQLGFNIVEGSVSVLLNGQPLQQNVDYTVDYISGDVVIRNPQALAPGASVQVKYEQNDLFQLAAKTLIGARGELNLSANTIFGFTLMNLNQATLSDKVRLGEEPTNNMILGVDGSTTMNLPFLTKAIDALPLIRTKEMSSLRFSGEAAYMLPDPNTKKSTIGGDLSASIAYIDDFEGARRTIPFNITYSGWHLSSPPAYTLLGPNAQDTTKTYSKAKLIWYNKLPSDVTTHEIWPNRSVRVGQDQVTVLNLDFFPDRRGIYNFSPNLLETIHAQPHKNWGGIMRYISTTGGNIIDQNINYLEIWMKASSNDITDLRKGKIYVDLGRVSEQVIPTLSPKGQPLHSEDLVVNDVANGVLNPGEDVGIDMLSDEQEKNDPRTQAFLAANAGDPDVDPNDPSGDDWLYSAGSTDYSKINGTEKNEASVDGRLPDTEDLNGNGEVDLGNTYLEYELPLDSVYYDTLGNLKKNQLIVGGGTDRWYQFRIPLLQATRVIPLGTDQSQQTVLQNVQYIRLWTSGFEKPVSIRIAEIDLVGNQWQELVRDDSTMKVSVVNIEDNPSYRSPPGVIREVDRTQPDQNVLGNEQSLDLIIKGLRRGESRQAVKYFTRPLDVFSYKAMKMFVHGDPLFDYIGPDYYDAEVFLRFGSDSLNFYEYRQPIRAGWDPLNDITVDFSELTSIKAARDSLNSLYLVPVKNGHPGASYGIQGNPSLTQIRYMGIGVTHVARQSRKSLPLNGEVWVNELRVVQADNSPGLAYRFDSQVKLADFGNFGFNYSKIDPNFHGLDQRFGNRVTGINWALNTSLALEKFFPQSWEGTSIPFGYSHAENMSKPKYLPNTDVLVEAAASRAAEQRSTNGTPTKAEDVVSESQTLHVQDSYTLSNFHIGLPTNLWFIRDTFGKLTFGFNYSKSSDRDPATLERTSWLWNLRVNYGVSLPPDYYVQPFKYIFNGIFLLDEYKDWKFYYLPITNIVTGLNGNRSRTNEISRAQSSISRETRNFGVNKSLGFGWKLTEGGLLNLAGDYSLNLDRSLLYLDNDSVGRGFSTILKNMFFGGKDNHYAQRVTVNSKPNIPDVLDIQKYFDLSTGYSVNYDWQNSFQQGDLGKNTHFANNITISTNFRLKALTDPWFQSTSEGGGQVSPNPDDKKEKSESKIESQKNDTTTTKSEKTQSPKKSNNLLLQLKALARIFLKIPFLDYESISLNFAQSNQAGNSGIQGSTGFSNFWGRWPFQGSLLENGPSRLYQLGIISDPSGTLRFSPKSSFPFLGWTTVRGLRAPNATLTDQYSQTNNISLRTTRPLWEGASLEFNWKVGWQYSKSTTVSTDSLGRPTLGSSTTAGSVERSFLSIPPVLFFKVFKSSLEGVGKKYDELKSTEPPDVALSEAFEKGLETLPFLNKVFGPYFPRPNWTLHWDGIEKIAGMSSVVEKLSLEHSYSSSFKRDFRGTPEGGERTDAERVSNGFSPLVGVNATFKELLKGSFSGNLRFNTSTSYDLNLSAGNIVETLSQEISLALSYARKGFSFPLFGLNLNNDVDMSMTYSLTRNSRKTYDPTVLSSTQDGVPLEGNTRTSLEPRIRYVLSSRVTAALFYRYTKVAPDEGGSLVPGTTTNEAGLDIHIAIQ